MVMQFRTLFDNLDAALSDAALSHALSTFARHNGFDHHAYLSLEGHEICCFSTFPKSWQNLYLTNGFTNLDPVVGQARRKSGPFVWSATNWLRASNTELSCFSKAAIEHGITHGLTVSARSSFDRQLILSFASSNKHSWQLDALEMSDSIPVLMGLHYRLQHLRHISRHSSPSPLSSQERLCLIWAAKGKTAPEIGMLAQLSARTVQHYLDAARLKLGASTVAQLVALAKDMKVI
jgi:LuxR family transcriptional regulator, activator of conjugal transfer of Ti plasmids